MREIMVGDSAQRAEQIRTIQLDPSIPPEQKGAKIRELMIGMGFPTANVPIGGQPVPSTGSTDAAATVNALTKFAALRDRGLLTDAEFQAQKAKLLGA